MKSLGIGLAALLLSSPCGADTGFEAPDRSVTLDAAAVKRMGIVAAQATAADHRDEIQGFGLVMPLDAIAQTEADLTVAESASRLSQAALTRAHGLFGAEKSISRQAVEAAEHQAAADEAQLTLARRKSQAAWGRDAPWHDTKQLSALIAKLGAGDAVIVRATFPAMDDLPDTIHVARLDADGQDWAASKIWAAPADPTLPGRSVFLLIENRPALQPGERVRVAAQSGPKKQGAIVPAEAIIIAEGRTWLYVREKDAYFVRQAIDIAQPTKEGYFTADAVQPGEWVVTHGAGHLLARETGAAD